MKEISLKDNSTFFNYQIQKKKGSYILIEVSRKHLLQMFVAVRTERPDKEEHQWAFGDFEKEFIDTLRINPYMRDLFIAANPFEVINDDIDGCNAQVNYKGEYTNLIRFPTAFWNKQDCLVDQSYFTTLKG